MALSNQLSTLSHKKGRKRVGSAGFRTEDQGGTAPGLFVPGLRIESEPDQIARIRHEGGHLPDFPAFRRFPTNFMMAVPQLDCSDKLIERVLATTGPEHNASVACQIEREPVAFGEPRLVHNGARNPHRQTVSPFCTHKGVNWRAQ